MIEQQEMRRHQKEQAEKERIRVENEKRREKEEEEALEKARYILLFMLCIHRVIELILLYLEKLLLNNNLVV